MSKKPARTNNILGKSPEVFQKILKKEDSKKEELSVLKAAPKTA